MDKGTAALPIGYFMKLCYADSQLQVSKSDFDRPANLSIKVDCYTAPKSERYNRGSKYR
jgi:penicillin-binding protein 1A